MLLFRRLCCLEKECILSLKKVLHRLSDGSHLNIVCYVLAMVLRDRSQMILVLVHVVTTIVAAFKPLLKEREPICNAYQIRS